MQVCVLASGSSGNCVYVASKETRILVDAGLSFKETDRRLELIDVDVLSLNAVCVTHEHDDHTASLGVMYRKVGLELFANTGTVEAMTRNEKLRDLPLNVFTTGSPFDVGDMGITPFSVPHDSYDPVGFIVKSGNTSVGIVTDMGMATGLIREQLRNCRVVVIEANHDEQMLKDSDRPWPLKQRIMGRHGHLSNSNAGELICEIAGPHLKAVFLAHLSSDCNDPGLAFAVVREALDKNGHPEIAVHLTYPDRSSDVVTF